MLRNIFFLLFISTTSLFFAQQGQSISSMDFVEILNDNEEEALFYYQKNWKVLRQMAIKKNYISSFELLKDISNDKNSFSLILVTTYTNREQFEKREEHFQVLIKEKGRLELLNQKKPAEFRKTVFSKDLILL
jgi:hypothetical protein